MFYSSLQTQPQLRPSIRLTSTHQRHPDTSSTYTNFVSYFNGLVHTLTLHPPYLSHPTIGVSLCYRLQLFIFTLLNSFTIILFESQSYLSKGKRVFRYNLICLWRWAHLFAVIIQMNYITTSPSRYDCNLKLACIDCYEKS